MTQEEKDLLLKDLCARLPYGVIYQVARPAFPSNELRVSNEKLRRIEVTIDGNYGVGCNSATLTSITKIKPYLRPLSSMTDEEISEFLHVKYSRYNEYAQVFFTEFRKGKITLANSCANYAQNMDWLNAHHFDYRRLIDKGLAIEVTEDNNPYKD